MCVPGRSRRMPSRSRSPRTGPARTRSSPLRTRPREKSRSILDPMRCRPWLAAIVLVWAGCGDNRIHPGPVTPDARGVCGNAIVEDGEDCDDGDRLADPVCDDACHFTCGESTPPLDGDG